MDSFAIVHLLNETSDLLKGIIIVPIFRQPDGFFLDRSNHALGVAILRRFADLRHTDFNPSAFQRLNVTRRRILHTLIQMMNLRFALGQGSLQGGQSQMLIQRTSQVPTVQTAREHIHHDGQVYTFFWQMDIRDIRDPDLIRSHHR